MVSTGNERYSAHANGGFHVDVDDRDRNRIDNSMGVQIAATPWLTLLVEQIWRLEIFGDDPVQKFEFVPGVKVNPFGTVVAGINLIVPLNEEGLTTDFTPNGVGEVSFTF